MLDYLPHATIVALVDALLMVVLIPYVLSVKRDSTAATAWCMLILLVPLGGALMFWMFGSNYVNRGVKRRRTHRYQFKRDHPPDNPEATRSTGDEEEVQHPMVRMALAVDAFPASNDNQVTLYHETTLAFQALLEAIESAKHNIHLEFFIWRGDATGKQVLDLLTKKAQAGVEVRLMYDSVGGLFLPWGILRPLEKAGGKVITFLPVNPLQSWIRINLRNHRKIAVIDGRVGFTGGLNIGDEYLHKNRYFGYWRDSFVRIEGPAVAGLQRVFIEDWHFASGEAVTGRLYFPELSGLGEHGVQIIDSGPDQEWNSIRAIYVAAILSARDRLWIASPYFVPDRGVLDALRLARMRGVDVRLLCLGKPDHFLSYHASRYYFTDLLAAGAKVYEYLRGMMHSKVIIVDDSWASVGSANLDNRSLHLNFELNALIYTPSLVADLAQAFERDLGDSRQLEPQAFADRSFMARLKENACRLFSPVL